MKGEVEDFHENWAIYTKDRNEESIHEDREGL